MTESFFFTETKMTKDLGLSSLDEIVFSDYTQNHMMYYQPGIRFTKEMLFLCQTHRATVDLGLDDWQDWDFIEICPWENIISIDRYEGLDVIRSVSQKEIKSWLMSLEEIPLSFPIVRVTAKDIGIIMEGRPYSERSQRSLVKQKSIYENLLTKITTIVKKPLTVPTILYIDVFTTQEEELPDVDRFVQPIMDFFKGILYVDDSQIHDLHPRIFKMDNPFTILECRSEPMSLSSVENIPVGSLFPLVKNVKDYYVIRFRIH